MKVSRATSKDAGVLAALAEKLWPGHELEDAGSLRFHLHAGFAQANRIICFRKDL